MICNNNYLADILMVWAIKDLIWVVVFQNLTKKLKKVSTFLFYVVLIEWPAR